MALGTGSILAAGSSCSSQPADLTTKRAQHAGGYVSSLGVPPFELLLLRNADTNTNTKTDKKTNTHKKAWAKTALDPEPKLAHLKRLRVYLAGDGSPWRGNRVAADPGPHQPVAVQLMLDDPEPSWLIGRPCYHRKSALSNRPVLPEDQASCDPSLWTFERYGERVLNALERALAQLLDRHGSPTVPVKVTLIGYSGGGVLALLLAQRVAAVDEVITIAAPLDVAAWTSYHGHTPLVGSLDPARLTQRRPLRELHLQGKQDRQVPPATTDEFFKNTAQGSNTSVERVITETDGHQCCWAKGWPHMAVRRFGKSRPEGM